MMRILVGVFLLFCSVLTFGQISVSVFADKDTINIGDEVVMNYKINVPSGVDINALDFNSLKQTFNYGFEVMPERFDSLMDIDVLDGGSFGIDNYNLIISKERLQKPLPREGSISIRVSSAGLMKLPKPLVLHDSAINEIQLQTPQLFVKEYGEMTDINPNKENVFEKITWRDYVIYVYIYLGVAAFLLCMYLIITYLRKGEKGFNVKKEIVIIPADEKALKALNDLKEKELWQNGDTKGYHTELTRIMRQYIEDRYDVRALEMTSSQLKREMKSKGIDSGIIKRFDDILQIADKVKFAKGSTGPELNVRFMDEAFLIVEETKEIPPEGEEVK